MIVVDVNVLAHLLIEGEHTSQVEALLRWDPEWAAPLLWRSEWRSVLSGYLRRGAVDRSAVLEQLGAASELIREREFLVDGARVMSFVETSSCSAYDCEYVALADALGVPLVTYDRRILDEFPGRAFTPGDLLKPPPGG